MPHRRPQPAWRAGVSVRIAWPPRLACAAACLPAWLGGY